VVIGCGHIIESWRKALTTKLHFGDRDLESRDVSQQEFATCEIAKCRNAKNTFWCRFRISGIGVSKHFTTGMPKCRNEKWETTRDPVLVIQRCWILGNLIEGLLFLFTVNRSVTIQLAELNHDLWTVGDSVADVFSWRFTV
jgi:hypothetical protein